MPCVLERLPFLAAGGYPEGNLADGVVVNRLPRKGDRRYVSGDVEMFRRMMEAGYEQKTVFSSVVYHMQEGEMRS